MTDQEANERERADYAAAHQPTEGDKTFIDMVLYFWEDKGDLTSYTGWDEARCVKLMPAFWHAYQQFKMAEDVLERVARSYR